MKLSFLRLLLSAIVQYVFSRSQATAAGLYFLACHSTMAQPDGTMSSPQRIIGSQFEPNASMLALNWFAHT